MVSSELFPFYLKEMNSIWPSEISEIPILSKIVEVGMCCSSIALVALSLPSDGAEVIGAVKVIRPKAASPCVSFCFRALRLFNKLQIL